MTEHAMVHREYLHGNLAFVASAAAKPCPLDVAAIQYSTTSKEARTQLESLHLEVRETECELIGICRLGLLRRWKRKCGEIHVTFSEK